MRTRYRRKSAVHRQTAESFLSRRQTIINVIVVVLGAVAITLWPVYALRSVIAIIEGFSVLFFIPKIATHIASLRYVPLGRTPASINDPRLPMYTIFIPLSKELGMLPSIVTSTWC
jgi:uncharacterized membrane protein